MKNLTVLIASLLFTFSIKAQLSEGGKPLSFSQAQFKSSSPIENLQLRKLNHDKLIVEDKAMGINNRYGIVKKKEVDIKKKGTAITIEQGTIWQYAISSKNAYSLGLNFSQFNVPEGAKLYLYNKDYSIIYGAFTAKNNKSYGSLAIAEFPGNELYIEYFEPNNAQFEGILVLGAISQAYRDIQSKGGFGLKSTEGSTNIDITCPEGNKHQLEKHAVAKMTFSDREGSYLCTGALINNTRNDGKPYFLTANHCLSTTGPTSSLVTYYNFEAPNCKSLALQGQNLSGSELIATWQASDMTLLLLSESPTPEIMPYFAGWDAEVDDSLVFGAGIHHPAGIEKKIALDYDIIYSFPYENNWDNEVTTPPNSHWLVEFDQGSTEGGSSGSPIFDSTKKIFGQLHGGGDGYDLYGKLSRSWVSGTQNNERLKPWLDPDNTGTLKLDGYTPSSNNPEAYFFSDFTNVCAGEAVTLKNVSNFAPSSYTWTISPANAHTFLEGTNASSENPVVSFNDNPGMYSISLDVAKSSKTDIKERNQYINSGEIEVSVYSSDGNSLCAPLFSSLRVFAEGAVSYQWQVIDTNNIVQINDSSQLNKDHLVISKSPNAEILNNLSFKIILSGEHNSCSDTDTVIFQFLGPENDYIEDAIALNMGESGPFTNECAGVQENEPYPEGGNCSSQLAWCDCEISEILIDNSVWFTFIGPESGIVGINAPGFDNQIAIYDADSASDILSGNENKYLIIAANDDYFGEELEYSALIKNASVTPGKTYWLQVDGSACGASGEFMLTLYDVDISDTFPSAIFEQQAELIEIKVFPNPASESFSIESSEVEGATTLSLITIDGRIVESYSINNAMKGENYKFPIPTNTPNGLYLLKIQGKNKVWVQNLAVFRE